MGLLLRMRSWDFVYLILMALVGLWIILNSSAYVRKSIKSASSDFELNKVIAIANLELKEKTIIFSFLALLFTIIIWKNDAASNTKNAQNQEQVVTHTATSTESITNE